MLLIATDALRTYRKVGGDSFRPPRVSKPVGMTGMVKVGLQHLKRQFSVKTPKKEIANRYFLKRQFSIKCTVCDTKTSSKGTRYS